MRNPSLGFELVRERPDLLSDAHDAVQALCLQIVFEIASLKHHDGHGTVVKEAGDLKSSGTSPDYAETRRDVEVSKSVERGDHARADLSSSCPPGGVKVRRLAQPTYFKATIWRLEGIMESVRHRSSR